MPIYEYRCASCGHQQEFLQKVSDAPLTVCTECGKPTFSKMLTAAGFQLKGSGWYATDFKNKGGSTAAKKDAKEGAGEAKGDSKGESKGDSKSEGSKDAAKRARQRRRLDADLVLLRSAAKTVRGHTENGNARLDAALDRFSLDVANETLSAHERSDYINKGAAIVAPKCFLCFQTLESNRPIASGAKLPCD